MDYVIKRKLTLAAKALLETDDGILDIALDYGYDSRDGFSRSFKAFMGVTPAEYRKHRQKFTSQKPGKEYRSMEYSKTTNAVIREIEEWISQAKALTKQIRQTDRQTMNAFWKGVADQTDILADNSLQILDKVNSMTQSPDEITDGMDIVKTIDDTAFVVHCIAFQIEMTEAKMPELAQDDLFAERYRSFAWSGVEKAKKITEFFRELLLLVVEDMRKTTGDMINNVVEKGKAAAAGIPDNFNYIKDEIIQIADILSTTPVESITMQMLDDSFFKMRIIAVTAKLNIDAADDKLFDDINTFSDALYEAAEFCRTIVLPKEEPSQEQKIIKIMQDITYMENVIFIYANGEIEQLVKEAGKPGTQVKAAEYEILKAKINDYKKTAFFAEREENDVSVFQKLADKVSEIVSDLSSIAEKLGARGGAIKVIADEQKRLADKTTQLAKDIKGFKSL